MAVNPRVVRSSVLMRTVLYVFSGYAFDFVKRELEKGIRSKD